MGESELYRGHDTSSSEELQPFSANDNLITPDGKRGIRNERPVAIKTVHPRGRQSLVELERDLEQIVVNLNRIEHPEFNKPYVLETTADSIRIITPLLQGQNLGQVVAQKTLPVEETIKMGISIAGQLAEAHDYGIIHRDAAPQNILKSDKGYHITDFSVAKQVGGLKTYNIPGTRGYRALEALEDNAEPRSDIYTLTQSMLFALDGNEPSASVNAAELRSYNDKRINELSINPELKKILRKAAAPEAEERYTARELVHALQALEPRETPAMSPASPAVTRLDRYKVPEELKQEITEVLAIFKHEYAPFIDDRKPIEEADKKKIERVLTQLGYEKVEATKRNEYAKGVYRDVETPHPLGTHFIRRRRESKDLDILLFHDKLEAHERNYVKFLAMSEEEYELNAVYLANEYHPSPKAGISIANIAGMTAGLSTEIAAFTTAYALGGGQAVFALSAGHVVLGAAGLFSAPYGDAGEHISKFIPGYWIGNPVYRMTQWATALAKQAKNSIVEQLKDPDYAELEHALQPAPGFTYDTPVDTTSSPQYKSPKPTRRKK